MPVHQSQGQHANKLKQSEAPPGALGAKAVGPAPEASRGKQIERREGRKPADEIGPKIPSRPREVQAEA